MHTETFKKRSIFLLAIVFNLFALGLNGTDIGLPSFVTFNRIGFIILVILLIINRSPILVHKNTTYLIFLVSTLLLLGLLSALFSPAQQYVSFLPIIDLILGLVIIICTFNVTKRLEYIDLITFLKFNVYISLLISFIFYVYFSSLIIDVGISNNWGIRRELNESISVGMSRLINGLFIINAINFGVLILQKNNIYTKLYSTLSIFLFVVTIVITGSRQNLLAFLVFVLFLIILKVINAKKISFKLFFATSSLIIIIVLFYQYLVPDVVHYWIERRFIEDTENQMGSNNSRFQIIISGLEMIKQQMVFGLGLGPGTFTEFSSNNLPSHNGYINVLATFGPIAFLLIVITNIFVITKSIFVVYKYNNDQDTLIILSSLFVAFTIINVNFNDLLYDSFYWFLLSLVMANINFKTKEKTKILHPSD